MYIAKILSQLLFAAEFKHGLAVRFFWRQSAGDVVLREFLDVKMQLAIDVAFESVSAKDCL